VTRSILAPPSALPNITTKWTLFLDRDGVINEPPEHLYARNWQEFHFCKGSLEALRIVSTLFGRVIIVTNQQGIGKGLMRQEDLSLIHKYMCQEIEQAGGDIDAVYSCPALEEEEHPERKPNPGMAHRACEDFPEIDMKRSVMVGDKRNDIAFGQNLSMFTVLITMNSNIQANADFHFSSLFGFAKYIEQIVGT